MTQNTTSNATGRNYRIRMYVGPLAVQHYADRARKLNYGDVLEGTEHIHFTAHLLDSTDRTIARQRLAEIIYGGVCFRGFLDVEILREA